MGPVGVRLGRNNMVQGAGRGVRVWGKSGTPVVGAAGCKAIAGVIQGCQQDFCY